ncbi:hypothetical protein BK138_32960 [Paenibacillus rhizosphaerae]|uniref:Uncharacterized protein n=1 Tax=Paenibacillus rhizosphaerae TaxID=297318 RepID=A0A1R1E518_9BACL|nr:hypothetical protein BK138_32960 [Paenibacillus rhizosphaerae]
MISTELAGPLPHGLMICRAPDFRQATFFDGVRNIFGGWEDGRGKVGKAGGTGIFEVVELMVKQKKKPP